MILTCRKALAVAGTVLSVLCSWGEMLAPEQGRQQAHRQALNLGEAGEEVSEQRAVPSGPQKGQRTVSRDAANPRFTWQ